jgi:hypothetical protein
MHANEHLHCPSLPQPCPQLANLLSTTHVRLWKHRVSQGLLHMVGMGLSFPIPEDLLHVSLGWVQSR